MTREAVWLVAKSNPLTVARLIAARIRGEDAIVSSDGVQLVVGTKRGEGVFCALKGRDYEEMRRFLHIAQRMPAGSIFFDVGANVGTYAIRVATENPHLRVVALEALGWNRARIRRSCALNRCSVDVPDLGVSDTHGMITIPLQSSGRASIRAPQPMGSVSLATTTIDHLAERHAPGMLRLLKIDIDGMCLQALKGGLRTISKRETVIYFENDPGVPDFLRSLGYIVGSWQSGVFSETDIGWALWAVPPALVASVS